MLGKEPIVTLHLFFVVTVHRNNAPPLVANTNNPPRCAFCQQSHLSTDCKSVTDINSRKRVLRETGRCFNCLRKGHMSRLCHSAKLCHGRHYTTVCNKNSQQPVRNLANKLNSKSPPYSPDKANNTPNSNSNNQHILICKEKKHFAANCIDCSTQSTETEISCSATHSLRHGKSAFQF